MFKFSDTFFYLYLIFSAAEYGTGPNYIPQHYPYPQWFMAYGNTVEPQLLYSPQGHSQPRMLQYSGLNICNT